MKFETFKLDADTNIDKDLKPYSSKFQDIYHSDDGALDEVKHVFISPNLNIEKLNNKNTHIIGELGFGFGVSFLETCSYVSNKLGDNFKLNYFSIEAYPQSKDNIINFYDKNDYFNNPALRPYLNSLIEQYPEHIRGIHRIQISKNIILTLAFHLVEELRSFYSISADSWFLDGFSPSKNEEMWNEDTFKWIYNSTKEGGTFSTYSVSESVQLNAKKSGFNIKKLSGFGRKKSMLFGEKEIKESIILEKISKPKIAIIGGGLSGASLAYSLSQREVDVEIFEQESSLSKKASGNKAAVFMPHLSVIPDALSRYYLTGYLYTLRILNTLNKTSKLNSLKTSGVLRLSSTKKWEKILSKLSSLGLPKSIAESLTVDEIKNKLSLNSNESGIFFPLSGSVNLAELVKCLLDGAKIHLNTKIIEVKEDNNKVIIKTNREETLNFDYLIFANGYELNNFNEYKWLPFEKIKGQLFTAPYEKNSEISNYPLCYDGYIVPFEDEVLIGATYEHNKHETEFSEDVVLELSSRLNNHFPNIKLSENINEGRVCFRTTSPDRFPMIGMLTKDEKIPSRVFTSIGHGSHGTTSCLLAAEIITSQILKEPSPVEDDILLETSPIRFIKREVKRNKPLEEIYPASYIWR